MRSWKGKHERVEIYFFLSNFRFWPREQDPESLLFSDVCPVPSTLKVERNPTTGELLGYNEVKNHTHFSLSSFLQLDTQSFCVFLC